MVRVKVCAVMSSVDGKPDALSDAGSSPGAVACSSHSFACTEGAGLTAVLSAPLPRDDTVFDREQFKWALTMIEAPAEPPCGEISEGEERPLWGRDEKPGR